MTRIDYRDFLVAMALASLKLGKACHPLQQNGFCRKVYERVTIKGQEIMPSHKTERELIEVLAAILGFTLKTQYAAPCWPGFRPSFNIV